ncbi:hypothetical protein EIP91_005154 [Steccherinum ochraceum]|uniref:Uncharacterized protein n=1 Tax=Steccherinum ochraceum TaxID=92696 RepID=A0A4V2MVU6_9APHY|nr:hypothetical protein EIP91_005154 [Steccherinum ochraceum]
MSQSTIQFEEVSGSIPSFSANVIQPMRNLEQSANTYGIAFLQESPVKNPTIYLSRLLLAAFGHIGVNPTVFMRALVVVSTRADAVNAVNACRTMQDVIHTVYFWSRSILQSAAVQG